MPVKDKHNHKILWAYLTQSLCGSYSEWCFSTHLPCLFFFKVDIPIPPPPGINNVFVIVIKIILVMKNQMNF